MLDPLTLTSKLCKELDKRQRCVKEAEDWYDGNHPVPVPPPNTPAATVGSEAHKAFLALSHLSITNLLPPVADVPASALTLEGIRYTDKAASAQAWAAFQRNHMDADSPLANHTAVKTGQSFTLVWVDAAGRAVITVEDPSQCIVMYEAGSRRKRAAALKRWIDDEGYTLATLYLPDWIYKWRSASPSTSLLLPASVSPDGWEPRQVEGETWPLANPFGEVNVVEHRANAVLRSSQFGGGTPQFAKQINEQRKLNRTVMGLLIAEDNQSFRQRWATDWAYPTKEDGTPDEAKMARFSSSRMAIFSSGDEDTQVKVGEFAQADFQPFLGTILMWIKVMASTSGTPPYAFLLGDMINVAADSLARIEGIQLGVRETLGNELGESWKETARLALKAEGNPDADDPSASVVWAEFERRTATEQVTLAEAMARLGAPLEAVLAALPGVTQETAQRWAIEKAADELLAPDLVPVAAHA